jgi:hypothetical protein
MWTPQCYQLYSKQLICLLSMDQLLFNLILEASHGKINDRWQCFSLEHTLGYAHLGVESISKKILKEWNSQINPLYLEKSFIANCFGPSKFHGSSSNLLHDLLNFFYIYNPTIFLWCGKLYHWLLILPRHHLLRPMTDKK